MLIDLSAAYDTVWQAGLMMKLSKAIKCRTTIKLIASLISQWNFQVFLGNQVSRKRILKNGLHQGSVGYLRHRSSTYMTSLQPSRWSLDICWWMDPCHTIKDMFTSWEYTVPWYRTPERLEATPKRNEDGGDLLSPGQQTGCQKTESNTSGRSACTRLCTKVPRCNSW